VVQLYKRKGEAILVNTETFGNQTAQHVAVLSDGSLVVVWSDLSGLGGDSSDSAVKAQRYDSSGNKLGAEFLVNTAVEGFQGQPKVIALAGGKFMVTWTSLNGDDLDGAGSGIKGQLFNADGTASGAEILINTSAPELQLAPAIISLTGGGLVVAWVDGSGLGGDPNNSIKMQLFDATGAKIGGEILVNGNVEASQNSPTLTALASGGFVASWVEPGFVKCQLFDNAGARVGAEIQVNAAAFSASLTPSMTAVGTGFVVVWSHFGGAGGSTGFDVSAQLFDANGAKIGGEFSVNETVAGDQRVPEVRALPNGLLLVTWQGPGTDGYEIDVFGQVLTSAGQKVGSEFRINGITPSNQIGARIAVLPSGDIVLTWADSSGIGGDSSGFGIKMQILTPTSDAPTDILLSSSTISETAREGTPLIVLSSEGAVNSTFSYSLVSDSSGGAFAIQGDALVVVDNSLINFEALQQVQLRIRTTDLNGNSYEETVQIVISDSPEAGYAPEGSQVLVNVTTEDNQSEAVTVPLQSGGFVMVWADWEPFGGAPSGRARLFDADGNPLGGEIPVNGFARGAGLSSGGFVVVGLAPDGDGSGVVATLYDASGAVMAGPIPVNTSTAGEVLFPQVSTLGAGFVVTWTDYVEGPFGGDVRAQIFDGSGARVGTEFLVDQNAGGSQQVSEVTTLSSGNFVIAWTDGSVVKAQIFSSSGVRLSSELSVSPGGMVEPHITALASGGFVVTWAQNLSGGGFTGIGNLSAQIYDASGVAIGGSFLISSPVARVQSSDVAALPWGGFVVTWTGYDAPGTNDSDIRAQVFDGSGALIGDQLLVNQATAGDQFHARVAVLNSGEFVVSWTDQGGTGGDADGFAVKARLFSLTGAGPINGTPGPDQLTGTPGDDVINGLDGDDRLIGGAGSDILTGGLGDDWYFVDASDTVIEGASEGTGDRVFAGTSYTLTAGAHIEVLSTNFHAGTAAINLSGNELGNVIYGNAGNNVLDGKGGIDTLVGFGGDDWYYVDHAGDYVVEGASEGTGDRVFASTSYTLTAGAHIEILSTDFHAGTAAIKLSGNALGNVIYGNAGNNVLDGKGGVDTLVGFGGDDWYYVDHAGDYVVEGASEGTGDRVFASTSYTLTAGAHIEILSTDFHAGTAAINLSGNELGNLIFGNAGNNVLNGRGGIDTLVGFGGNDFYFVDHAGDFVVEGASEGTGDRIFASVSYTLAPGSHIEILSTDFHAGTAAINLSGNELGNLIYGNAGSNVLDGKRGNDTLVGFGGADTFAFTTALAANNVDILADFDADDVIALDDAVFAGLSLGGLSAGAFTTGTAAQDADDRIIYDTGTGRLYYDADGNGAGAQMLFATLSNAPALTASDFIVI
jgi:Ca2+-binding RTX toxin-like protein